MIMIAVFHKDLLTFINFYLKIYKNDSIFIIKIIIIKKIIKKNSVKIIVNLFYDLLYPLNVNNIRVYWEYKKNNVQNVQIILNYNLYLYYFEYKHFIMIIIGNSLEYVGMYIF